MLRTLFCFGVLGVKRAHRFHTEVTLLSILLDWNDSADDNNHFFPYFMEIEKGLRPLVLILIIEGRTFAFCSTV